MRHLNFVAAVGSPDEASDRLASEPRGAYCVWSFTENDAEAYILSYKSLRNDVIFHIPMIPSGGFITVRNRAGTQQYPSVHSFVDTRKYLADDFILADGQNSLPHVGHDAAPFNGSVPGGSVGDQMSPSSEPALSPLFHNPDDPFARTPEIISVAQTIDEMNQLAELNRKKVCCCGPWVFWGIVFGLPTLLAVAASLPVALKLYAEIVPEAATLQVFGESSMRVSTYGLRDIAVNAVQRNFGDDAGPQCAQALDTWGEYFSEIEAQMQAQVDESNLATWCVTTAIVSMTALTGVWAILCCAGKPSDQTWRLTKCIWYSVVTATLITLLAAPTGLFYALVYASEGPHALSLGWSSTLFSPVQPVACEYYVDRFADRAFPMVRNVSATLHAPIPNAGARFTADEPAAAVRPSQKSQPASRGAESGAKAPVEETVELEVADDGSVGLQMPSMATVIAKPEPTPEPTPESTPVATLEPTPEPTPESTPVATLEPTPVATLEPTPEPTPESTPVATLEPTPEPTPESTPESTPVATLEPTPEPTPESTPVATLEPTPEPTPVATLESTPEPTPEPTPESTPVATLEPTPEPTPESTPMATQERTLEATSAPAAANTVDPTVLTTLDASAEEETRSSPRECRCPAEGKSDWGCETSIYCWVECVVEMPRPQDADMSACALGVSAAAARQLHPRVYLPIGRAASTLFAHAMTWVMQLHPEVPPLLHSTWTAIEGDAMLASAGGLAEAYVAPWTKPVLAPYVRPGSHFDLVLPTRDLLAPVMTTFVGVTLVGMLVSRIVRGYLF